MEFRADYEKSSDGLREGWVVKSLRYGVFSSVWEPCIFVSGLESSKVVWYDRTYEDAVNSMLDLVRQSMYRNSKIFSQVDIKI